MTVTVVLGVDARERIVGGPCEGCENVFVGMPAQLAPQARIAPEDEPGQRMVLEGTVRGLDGEPVRGVIVYAYHTDDRGSYPKAETRHGRLRGWARTDAAGHYRFDTIRPGPYPGRTTPQHIHMHVVEPGRVTYSISEVVFDDDPLLSDAERRSAASGPGGSGVVHPERDAAGVWHARRDIVLGLDVTGYPCPRRWTFPVPFHQSVSWSPDGRALVFSAVMSDWDEGYRLFVVDADGTGLRKLDSAGDAALYPVWSPDGTRVAYAARVDGNSDIYVMHADGSHVKRLTTSEANDSYPSWSPDGKQLVFHSNRAGNNDIWIMNEDGGGLLQLTDHEAHDTNPAWSPDARLIAFDSDRDDRDGGEIYVIAPDGSGLRRVVDAGVFPAWSPDGKRILYASGGLYAVDVDGLDQRMLLDHAVSAAWSPDGKTIAVASIEYDSECRDHHVLVTLPASGGSPHPLLRE
jgi:protocatechuate 3,4-dioxygenase beta subunit